MTDVAALHRRMLETVEQRDWGALEGLLHPDYVYTAGDGQPQPGVRAALDVAQTYTTAFPDLAFEILDQHTQGSVSIIEVRATGTQRAPLADIPPTGRTVDLRLCNVIEERDGKIVSEHEYFDSGVILDQLGVTEAMACSDRHKATASAIYEAFGRGDVDFILDQLAPDVSWDTDTPDWGLPWYEARNGRDEVRQFFEILGDELEFQAFEPVALLADDHELAAVIRFELTITSTGKKVRDTEIHLWEFDENGKVAKFSHIVDQHSQLLAYLEEGQT